MVIVLASYVLGVLYSASLFDSYGFINFNIIYYNNISEGE